MVKSTPGGQSQTVIGQSPTVRAMTRHARPGGTPGGHATATDTEADHGPVDPAPQVDRRLPACEPDSGRLSLLHLRIMGTAALAVGGEIDMVTAPVLGRHLSSCLDRPSTPPLLVVDLSGVDFLGAAALTVLVSAREQAQDHRTQLRIVARSRPVRRPITLTGLDRELTLCATMQEALRP